MKTQFIHSGPLAPLFHCLRAGALTGTAITYLVIVPACGDKPEAKTPASVDDEQPGFRPYSDNIQATAEIGAMHEDKTAQAFKESLPGLQRCLTQGAHRLEFLSGEIAFYVKINSDAKIEHIHAEQSTLGDRETEQCMFDVLKKASWPKPYGGETGIARNSFQFDVSDVRPPTDWDPERVETGLRQLGDKLEDCKHGFRGEFMGTMYVGTQGEVLSASVTPPNEDGEAAVDCLVATLREGAYERSGSWPAKVRFAL